MRNLPFDWATDSAPWPRPDIDQAAFIAPGAIVLGQVQLQPGSSVWYGAVIRGDLECITVGAYTNIQDGAVLHCDAGEPLVLEDYVTIGHRAVIHSAHVEQGCLIGIGAIVLNGVRIGQGSLIGAGAVVTKSVPPRSLVMGVPGKVVRELSEAEAADLIVHAQQYEQLALTHASKRLSIH
ncbi:MAG: gamma carbonic anhydrase family protein [Prochlorotrichaceae cyanobacterium]|jgi:carbonic anhydrase/acetyltransferase-like protein (isoleucine patch superfamily)